MLQWVLVLCCFNFSGWSFLAETPEARSYPSGNTKPTAWLQARCPPGTYQPWEKVSVSEHFSYVEALGLRKSFNWLSLIANSLGVEITLDQLMCCLLSPVNKNKKVLPAANSPDHLNASIRWLVNRETAQKILAYEFYIAHKKESLLWFSHRFWPPRNTGVLFLSGSSTSFFLQVRIVGSRWSWKLAFLIMS